MKVRNLNYWIFRESLWCFQPLGTSVHHQVRGFKIQIQSFASFTVFSLLTCFIWHDKDMQCFVYKRLFVSNLTLHKRPPLYLYGLFWNLHIFLDHLAEMVLTNCYFWHILTQSEEPAKTVAKTWHTHICNIHWLFGWDAGDCKCKEGAA